MGTRTGGRKKGEVMGGERKNTSRRYRFRPKVDYNLVLHLHYRAESQTEAHHACKRKKKRVEIDDATETEPSYR